MFTAEEFVSTLTDLGVTHVVWLPDSELGRWEEAIEASPSLRLVRVCREGEAWMIAAGLQIGGQRPIVAIQTTGLFESGDALRNVIHDLGLPIFAVIGHRSYLIPNSPDSAKHFAEPILKAWGLDYVLIGSPADKHLLAEHYRACQGAAKAGAVLIGEGRI